MSLLNRFFSSPESLEQEAGLDDEKISQIWQSYLDTVPEKEKILDRLAPGTEFREQLESLGRLVDIDLVDISGEEKREEQIISDIQSIEHSKKIKRLQRLEECLNYVETRYEYAHELLSHLYSILKNEMHIIKTLRSIFKDDDALISSLKQQFELEKEIIKRINDIKGFHELLLSLSKGEHMVKRMSGGEKALLEKMRGRMQKILSNQLQQGMTYEWTIKVYNAIEDKIHEGIEQGAFGGYHPNIDFEYVNRPEFILLAKDILKELKPDDVSEEMINAFVYTFREWYNHERD